MFPITASTFMGLRRCKWSSFEDIACFPKNEVERLRLVGKKARRRKQGFHSNSKHSDCERVQGLLNLIATPPTNKSKFRRVDAAKFDGFLGSLLGVFIWLCVNAAARHQTSTCGSEDGKSVWWLQLVPKFDLHLQATTTTSFPQSMLFYLLLSLAFSAEVRIAFEITNGTIAPDGFLKPNAVLINNRFPGPEINTTVGDYLILDITNRLTDGISIHLHGVDQVGTTFFDGAAGFSQSPIPPGTYSLLNQVSLCNFEYS